MSNHTQDERIKRLEDLGLSHSEATLYLAGLAHPGASARELCRSTGLKRPTAYYGLNALVGRGLAASTGTERKLRYTMADPAHLARLLDTRFDALERERSALETWVQALRQAPSVPTPGLSILHYEGKDGLRTALDEALYAKSRHWDVLAPFENVLRAQDRAFQTAYLHAREQRGLRARTLWERPPAGHRRLTPVEQAQREPRLLPESLHGRFPSMFILFDQKILILSDDAGPSALLIHSPAIHSLFLALFDGLWERAESYEAAGITNKKPISL